MKRLIVITMTLALFSATASANSGLADRINEARSYPNKTDDRDHSMSLAEQHKRLHRKINEQHEQPEQ